MRHLLERFDKLEVIRPIEFDAPNGPSAVPVGDTVTLIAVSGDTLEVEINNNGFPFALSAGLDQVRHLDCQCDDIEQDQWDYFESTRGLLSQRMWAIDLPESTS